MAGAVHLVAQVAATVGPVFRASVVAAVVGDEQAVADQVALLQDRGVLEPTPAAGTYRFRHALMRDAAQQVAESGLEQAIEYIRMHQDTLLPGPGTLPGAGWSQCAATDTSFPCGAVEPSEAGAPRVAGGAPPHASGSHASGSHASRSPARRSRAGTSHARRARWGRPHRALLRRADRRCGRRCDPPDRRQRSCDSAASTSVASVPR